MSKQKEYLGDSVYAEFFGDELVLTTENGRMPSNKIIFEPEILAALFEYLEVEPKRPPTPQREGEE